MLMDAGSFTEIGGLATHAPTRVTPVKDKVTPADGVVTGFGRIDGRIAGVVAEDFTVLGGSLGLVNFAKKHRMIELALRDRVPLVWLFDGAGRAHGRIYRRGAGADAPLHGRGAALRHGADDRGGARPDRRGQLPASVHDGVHRHGEGGRHAGRRRPAAGGDGHGRACLQGGARRLGGALPRLGRGRQRRRGRGGRDPAAQALPVLHAGECLGMAAGGGGGAGARGGGGGPAHPHSGEPAPALRHEEGHCERSSTGRASSS